VCACGARRALRASLNFAIRRNSVRVFIPAALVACVTAAAATPTERSSLVGLIEKQDAIDGCSWSAEAPGIGKGFFFLAEYDRSDVLMNILGADVHLRLDPTSTRGALKKLGDTHREVYRAPGVRVEAIYTVTWRCPPKETSCEDKRFKAVFRVHAGDKEQTIVAHGDVGC
jgi:hypothetical protein